MGWKGRVVIVAGVGAGLGSAVVATLGAAGATMLAVARSRASLDPLERAARTAGWDLNGVVADVTSAEATGAMVAGAVREFGHIDALSVNAGHWVEGDRFLHKMTDEEWSGGLKDNLDPIYRLGKATFPHFLERGGGAVVIVSAADRVRTNGNPSYCVAKGGLVELTRKLAIDYRAGGIRVNAVLPGTMEHEVDPLRPPPEGAPFRLRDQSGVGAWEVARTIRYLLSEESRWVTGACVTVDGGYSLHAKEQSAPAPP